jgi:hypothetical protein
VIKSFVKDNFELDEKLFEQLIDFQKNYLVEHSDAPLYPKTVTYDYDFLGFIQGTDSLDNQTSFEFDFPEDSSMSLQQFCEQIFFARRRNFGKSWITKQ